MFRPMTMQHPRLGCHPAIPERYVSSISCPLAALVVAVTYSQRAVARSLKRMGTRLMRLSKASCVSRRRLRGCLPKAVGSTAVGCCIAPFRVMHTNREAGRGIARRSSRSCDLVRVRLSPAATGRNGKVDAQRPDRAGDCTQDRHFLGLSNLVLYGQRCVCHDACPVPCLGNSAITPMISEVVIPWAPFED
jgi:hypothetical protein